MYIVVFGGLSSGTVGGGNILLIVVGGVVRGVVVDILQQIRCCFLLELILD